MFVETRGSFEDKRLSCFIRVGPAGYNPDIFCLVGKNVTDFLIGFFNRWDYFVFFDVSW
jgi:hypothetical protein